MVKISSKTKPIHVILDFTYLTACGMISAKQNFLFPCKENAISKWWKSYELWNSR